MGNKCADVASVILSEVITFIEDPCICIKYEIHFLLFNFRFLSAKYISTLRPCPAYKMSHFYFKSRFPNAFLLGGKFLTLS